VGKIVMAAAAKNLTPVILELGGKSPVIVDSNVDADVAARRIVWGRFVNCGQTCIAPDYVLCHKDVHDKLVSGMAKAIEEFYGKDPQRSADYGRIVNSNHFERVKRLLTSDGKIVVGGAVDASDNYIAPTVITGVRPDSALMKEEIFGPVLPVLAVGSVVEAINYVNAREKPLALYVFSKNNDVVRNVLRHTTSGGAVANDVIMHASVHTLPFGGVGNSGVGSYHGKFSFEAFSHRKGMMLKSLGGEAVNGIRYPPYSDRQLSWITWLLFPKLGKSNTKRNVILLAAALAVAGISLRRSAM